MGNLDNKSKLSDLEKAIMKKWLVPVSLKGVASLADLNAHKYNAEIHFKLAAGDNITIAEDPDTNTYTVSAAAEPFEGNLPDKDLRVGVQEGRSRGVVAVPGAHVGSNFSVTDSATGATFELSGYFSSFLEFAKTINARADAPVYAVPTGDSQVDVVAKAVGRAYTVAAEGDISVVQQMSEPTGQRIFLNGELLGSGAPEELPMTFASAYFEFKYAGNIGISFLVGNEVIAEFDVSGMREDDAEAFAELVRANEDVMRYFDLPTATTLRAREAGSAGNNLSYRYDFPRGGTQLKPLSGGGYKVSCFMDRRVYAIHLAGAEDFSSYAVEQFARFELLVDYSGGSATWPASWVWAEGTPPEFSADHGYVIDVRNCGSVTLASVRGSYSIN